MRLLDLDWSCLLCRATGDRLAVKVLPKQRGKLSREKTLSKIQQELVRLVLLPCTSLHRILSFLCMWLTANLQSRHLHAIHDDLQGRGRLQPLTRRVLLLQEVLAALQDCQQVVCLEDIFEDSQWVYIVQELCEGGDIAQALTVSIAIGCACLSWALIVVHDPVVPIYCNSATSMPCLSCGMWR